MGARIRLFVRGGTPRDRQVALDRLVAAYTDYGHGSGNTLRRVRCRPRAVATIARHPRLTLSSREAAALWYLPPSVREVPGLRRTGSLRILPAHPSLKDAAHGIPVGTSTVGFQADPVSIPIEAVLAHALITGKTGSGKSTIMQHLARGVLALRNYDLSDYYPHAVKGTQLCVVDPHGSLAETIVGAMSPAELAETIFVRFGHGDSSPGLNLLDMHAGRTQEQVVNTIKNLGSSYWDTSWGPRMADILEQAMRTLMTANTKRARAQQYTLLDVTTLLIDDAFRAAVVAEADYETRADYWAYEYNGLDDRERATYRNPILYKLNSFTNSPAIRRIIGQAETTLDLRDILRGGKHLIADTGALTEDEGQLVNAVLLGAIGDIVRERKEFDRHLFCMVDEFHTIPTRWSSLMTGIRKFGMSCWIASQGFVPLQKTEELLDSQVLNNVGTMCVFNSGDDKDGERIARLLGAPITFDDLKELGTRQAYIKTTNGGQALPACSTSVPYPPVSTPTATRIVAAVGARQTGRTNEEIDQEYRRHRRMLAALRAAAPSPQTGGRGGSGRGGGGNGGGSRRPAGTDNRR